MTKKNNILFFVKGPVKNHRAFILYFDKVYDLV